MARKRKKKPESYRERNYRHGLDTSDLVSFTAQLRETDLQIFASREAGAQASEQVLYLRNQLENYIAAHPFFIHALVPVDPDPLAPTIARKMIAAGQRAGVGPMAAVAGVISELVGEHLLADDGIDEVIVENGGDVFLARKKECTVSIFAGESPLSGRIGIRIKASEMPLGICTSSGTVGHSLSLGKADSVTVISPSTSLADAAATRLGNEVGTSSDINKALEIAASIDGITGAVIVIGEGLGAWGQVELVQL